MIISLQCFAEDYEYNDYYNFYYTKDADKVIYDPLQKFNKLSSKINMTLDRFILEPIALMYEVGVPKFAKARVSDFFDNLSVPISLVNNFLQKDVPSGLYNFWRFVINLTLGLCGFCDIASKMGIPENKQAFGNSLAYYGATPGPYIVLPVLGSANMRDVVDKFVNGNLLLLKRRANYIAVTTADVIVTRAKLIPFIEQINNMSIDQYTTIRSIYHQSRQNEIDKLLSNKK